MRFVRFNLVGAVGVGMQLLVLWALTGPAAMHYLPATAAAVAAAVLHNFLWHRAWTWIDRQPRRVGALPALARFAAANGAISLGGNIALMGVLVGRLDLAPVLANVLAIAGCGVLNYWAADRLVFPLVPVVLVQVNLPATSGGGTPLRQVAGWRVAPTVKARVARAGHPIHSGTGPPHLRHGASR